MSVLAAYARVSREGLLTASSEGVKRTSWAELEAGRPDEFGLPPLKGRMFGHAGASRFARMDPTSRLALGAAELVMAQAPGLEPDALRDMAVVGGSMLGCLEVDGQFHDGLLRQGPQGASPALFVYTLPSMFIGEVAIRFGIRGRCALVGAGRVSGLVALVNALRLVESGRTPRALALACDIDGLQARGLLAEPGRSFACAWRIERAGPALCGFSGAGFSLSEATQSLAAGEAGHGNAGLEDLESRVLGGVKGEVGLGDGANQARLTLS
jgi:3-oxoacyl-(acyl-carrier-protein) synthase